MFRSGGNIEEFKAIVAAGDGFATTNLYYVLLPRIGKDVSNRYEHGVMCSSVTLPSRQLATIQREVGVTINDVVHSYVHSNVSMTFRIMNDQKAREYFEYWQKLALNKYEDKPGYYKVAYPDSYYKEIKIYQLQKGTSFPIFNKFIDKNIDIGPKFLRSFGITNFVFDLDIDVATKMIPTYEWTLFNAYPVSVMHETLSDASSNEISTINVEFSFEHWKGEKQPGKNKLDEKITKIIGTVASIFN